MAVDQERRASWLELFFDLVFVVSIAQLSNKLVHDSSAQGFLEFVALYVPLWWAWVGFAFYAARFEFDDPLYRVLVLAAMMGTAAMAVNIGHAFGDTAERFALSYISVRMVLFVLYVMARARVPSARELTGFLAVGFWIGISIWIVSLAVPAPAKYGVWAVGMLVEGLVPMVGNQLLARTPVSVTHLPERFGLFMIIVLGESVLAVVTGTETTDWQLTASLVAAGAFVCAACMWWSYFDFAAWTARCGLLASSRTGSLARDVYSYGHFPIAVGLTLLGAGAKLAITDSAGGSLGAGARWALCGGIALYLIAICLLGAAIERSPWAIWWPRMSAACFAVALAAFGGALAALMLVALLVADVVGQLVLEIRREQPWERQRGPIEQPP